MVTDRLATSGLLAVLGMPDGALPAEVGASLDKLLAGAMALLASLKQQEARRCTACAMASRPYAVPCRAICLPPMVAEGYFATIC